MFGIFDGSTFRNFLLGLVNPFRVRLPRLLLWIHVADDETISDLVQ